MMASGRLDQVIVPENPERLAAILREAGADVDLRWRNTGHGLAFEEVAGAEDWLSRTLPEPS